MRSEENRTRLPGFTAQDSLYTTSGRYQLAAKWSGSTEGQAIVPQVVCKNCVIDSEGNANCESCDWES
jgi:hypothetical protein